uniref:NADH dehydrogenase (Ubiquinone) 1 alpha subcomplex, 4-like 2 n=1 Tax=Pan troglodytes TaxID=9598 RepID=K7BY48_PANTR
MQATASQPIHFFHSSPQAPRHHSGHPVPLLLTQAGFPRRGEAAPPLLSSLAPSSGSASDPWLESHVGEEEAGSTSRGPPRAQTSPSALLPGPRRVWHRLRVERGLREPTRSRGL